MRADAGIVLAGQAAALHVRRQTLPGRGVVFLPPDIFLGEQADRSRRGSAAAGTSTWRGSRSSGGDVSQARIDPLRSVLRHPSQDRGIARAGDGWRAPTPTACRCARILRPHATGYKRLAKDTSGTIGAHSGRALMRKRVDQDDLLDRASRRLRDGARARAPQGRHGSSRPPESDLRQRRPACAAGSAHAMSSIVSMPLALSSSECSR